MTREEAINIVRDLYRTDAEKEALQTLIPELFESEDEKVVLKLESFLSAYGADYFLFGELREIKVWLEKQKEQKQYDIDVLEKHITKDSVSELAHTVIIRNGWEIVEANEQKPISAVEVLARAGLKPYKDGNQWCILLGDNIQEGICGFGDTIDEALYQFLMEVLEKQKEQISNIDAICLSAEISKPYKDGNQWCILKGENIQEGVVGFGNTQEDALVDFIRNIPIKKQKPLSTEETELNSIAFLEQLGYTCVPPGKEQKLAVKQIGGTFNSYDMDAVEACMLRYLQSAANRKNDDEIMEDTRKYKQELINITQKPVEWSEEYREEDLRTRFAFYTYKNEEDDLTLYLSNVFVEEASRNKGFGTKILAAAEKVAETLGMISIRLKVKQDSPANAWYRKNGYGYIAFEDGYDWLEKNLEYMKPQKPAEWSEEDEKMLRRIIGHLTSFIYTNSLYGEDAKECIAWLKSLKPQPHWKPSEEQIGALENTIKCEFSAGLHVRAEILRTLYEQLKKL